LGLTSPKNKRLHLKKTDSVRQIWSFFSSVMESAPKRRRIQRSQSPTYKLDNQDDAYEPYVPVAERREAKLAKLTSLGATAEKDRAKKQLEELEERKDEEDEEAKRKENARKERTLLMEAQDVHSKKAEDGEFMASLSSS
jgi:ATP-dependent RNA helicase DDX41